MKRTAIGAVAGLAIWFGSALAAEAQVITPNGPASITAGAATSTYTATVTLLNPCYFYVRLNVYLNGTNIYYSQTFVPNPGTTTYNFSKVVTLTPAPKAGDTVKFSASLVVGGTVYAGPDWTVTVSGTRPSKTNVVAKTPAMVILSEDRDRRRE